MINYEGNAETEQCVNNNNKNNNEARLHIIIII